MTVRKKEKVHFQIQRLKNKKGIFSKKERLFVAIVAELKVFFCKSRRQSF